MASPKNHRPREGSDRRRRTHGDKEPGGKGRSAVNLPRSGALENANADDDDDAAAVSRQPGGAHSCSAHSEPLLQLIRSPASAALPAHSFSIASLAPTLVSVMAAGLAFQLSDAVRMWCIVCVSCVGQSKRCMHHVICPSGLRLLVRSSCFLGAIMLLSRCDHGDFCWNFGGVFLFLWCVLEVRLYWFFVEFRGCGGGLLAALVTGGREGGL